MRKAAIAILRNTPRRTKRCLSDGGTGFILSVGRLCLRGFLNFTGANAGRAYAQTLGGAVDRCVDRLQIQIPAALADVMGVADAVAKLRAAPAYIANSCHITRISSELRNLYSISRVGPSATLYSPKRSGMSASTYPITAMAATHCRNSCGFILSTVSVRVWCQSK